MANLNEVGGVVEPIVPVAVWVQTTPALVCLTLPERLVPLALMTNTRV